MAADRLPSTADRWRPPAAKHEGHQAPPGVDHRPAADHRRSELASHRTSAGLRVRVAAGLLQKNLRLATATQPDCSQLSQSTAQPGQKNLIILAIEI